MRNNSPPDGSAERQGSLHHSPLPRHAPRVAPTVIECNQRSRERTFTTQRRSLLYIRWTSGRTYKTVIGPRVRAASASDSNRLQIRAVGRIWPLLSDLCRQIAVWGERTTKGETNSRPKTGMFFARYWHFGCFAAPSAESLKCCEAPMIDDCGSRNDPCDDLRCATGPLQLLSPTESHRRFARRHHRRQPPEHNQSRWIMLASSPV